MPKASTAGRNGAHQRSGTLRKFPGFAAYLKSAVRQEPREDQELAKKYPRPLYGMHREEDMNIPLSDIRFDKHPKSNHLVYLDHPRQETLPVAENKIHAFESNIRDRPPAKNRHIKHTAPVVSPQRRQRKTRATPEIAEQPPNPNLLQSLSRSSKSPEAADSANPRPVEKRKAQEMDDAVQPKPTSKRARQTQAEVPQITADSEKPHEETVIVEAVASQTADTATEQQQVAKETATSLSQPRIDSVEPKAAPAAEAKQRSKTPTKTEPADDAVQPQETRATTAEPVKKGTGMYRGPWYYEDAANTSRKTWEDQIHDAARAAAEGAIQGRSMRTRKPVEKPQSTVTRRKRKADSEEGGESKKKVKESSRRLSEA